MSRPSWMLTLVAAVATFTSVWMVITSRKASRWEHANSAEKGWILIEESGCTGCHQEGSGYRAPLLRNLLGSEVQLADGSKVVADELYVKESIEYPMAKVTAGYSATMPGFKDRFSAEELEWIVAAMRPLP